MARQKAEEAERHNLGRMIRRAADEAGLSSTQLAVAMGGVTHQCVRCWWSGRTVPSALQMRKLAAVLGKPVAWFYGQPLHTGEELVLRTTLLAMCDALMAGQGGAQAWATAARDPEWLASPEQEYLSRHAPLFRATLARHAGAPWFSLDTSERLQIIETLLRAAPLGAVPPPAVGTDPAPAPRGRGRPRLTPAAASPAAAVPVPVPAAARPLPVKKRPPPAARAARAHS